MIQILVYDFFFDKIYPLFLLLVFKSGFDGWVKFFRILPFGSTWNILGILEGMGLYPVVYGVNFQDKMGLCPYPIWLSFNVLCGP
jgi:hypothetical protein